MDGVLARKYFSVCRVLLWCLIFFKGFDARTPFLDCINEHSPVILRR